mmetsp:Transcript_68351/g.120944  ORF Transcript_68351/g.120944 Transcript_68351/m.120944 type:complete len:263 (-) Transcript_68351:119-907(-)
MQSIVPRLWVLATHWAVKSHSSPRHKRFTMATRCCGASNFCLGTVGATIVEPSHVPAPEGLWSSLNCPSFSASGDVSGIYPVDSCLRRCTQKLRDTESCTKSGPARLLAICARSCQRGQQKTPSPAILAALRHQTFSALTGSCSLGCKPDGHSALLRTLQGRLWGHLLADALVCKGHKLVQLTDRPLALRDGLQALQHVRTALADKGLRVEHKGRQGQKPPLRHWNPCEQLQQAGVPDCTVEQVLQHLCQVLQPRPFLLQPC